METQERQNLADKQRIVIKIGLSSLIHVEIGEVNPMKIKKPVRVVNDLWRQGEDVALVSSRAIAARRQALGHHRKLNTFAKKQAFVVVDQARPMMAYQKLLAGYNQTVAQVLLIKDTTVNNSPRYNAQNTFNEPLNLGATPTVSENDTVSTPEVSYMDSFGDNDRLSAIVTALIGADLLTLLSDIDGLYADDSRENPEVEFISPVSEITPESLHMGRSTSGNDVGIGGMLAKLAAAQIVTNSGADMAIANGDQVDIVLGVMSDKEKETLFLVHTNLDFDLMHYPNNKY